MSNIETDILLIVALIVLLLIAKVQKITLEYLQVQILFSGLWS